MVCRQQLALQARMIRARQRFKVRIAKMKTEQARSFAILREEVLANADEKRQATEYLTSHGWKIAEIREKLSTK